MCGAAIVDGKRETRKQQRKEKGRYKMVAISDCLNLKPNDVIVSGNTGAKVRLTQVKILIGSRTGVIGKWIDGADAGKEYKADYDMLRFFEKEEKNVETKARVHEKDD